MILLLDNYDSFTYNLFQALAELGATVEVVRNDKTTVGEIESRLDEIEGVVVSPGPCTPSTPRWTGTWSSPPPPAGWRLRPTWSGRGGRGSWSAP